MATERVVRIQGKNRFPAEVGPALVARLRELAWDVDSAMTPQGFVLQASRPGFLDGLVAPDQALTVLLRGQPNDFNVRIGIGRRIPSLSSAAIAPGFLDDLFVGVDIAEDRWSSEIEPAILEPARAIIG